MNRITARDALYHPFLAPNSDQIFGIHSNLDDPAAVEDDELFPHPPGLGVCGQHHHQTKNGDWVVFVGYDEKGEAEWEQIEAGQGQAIGSKPCEFHEGFFYN